jgi:hypothetical protein
VYKRRKLAEYILGDYLLDLERGEEDKGFAWNSTINSERDKNKETRNAYDIMVGDLRSKVRTSEEYIQIVQLIDQLTVSAEEACTRDERLLKQKKRKLIRDLKYYTGARKKREKAYRGWSEGGIQIHATTENRGGEGKSGIQEVQYSVQMRHKKNTHKGGVGDGR